MKTTVDLPDDLLIAAKKRAAETRRPLKALIEKGLRIVLGRGIRGRRKKRPRIRWVTVPRALPPGLDVSNREAMSDWLRSHR